MKGGWLARIFYREQAHIIPTPHLHTFGPWRVERRVLVGPYGRTEDDVQRRCCTFPSCGYVQEQELGRVSR
jgi:hypothetical protein